MVSVDVVTVVLLVVVLAVGALIGYWAGAWVAERRKEEEFAVRTPEERRDAIARSRSSLGGQVLEKLAPYLPDFPYDPSEARFLGTPIDYVVFRGYATGGIKEVVFLEVKSGKGRLTTRERSVRDSIMSKNVRWDLYTLPISPAADNEARGKD